MEKPGVIALSNG